jgi:hypothetical protein
MAHQVFVSYSSKDAAAAEAVCAALEGRTIACWIAPRDIVPGDDYGESILDAIDTCRILLMIVSPHANQSSQIRRELERTMRTDTPIVPFRVAHGAVSKSLEYYTGPCEWLDSPSAPLEQHLRRLCDVVAAALSSQDGQAAPNAPPRPGLRGGYEPEASRTAAPLHRWLVTGLKTSIGVAAIRLVIEVALLAYFVSDEQDITATRDTLNVGVILHLVVLLPVAAWFAVWFAERPVPAETAAGPLLPEHSRFAGKGWWAAALASLVLLFVPWIRDTNLTYLVALSACGNALWIPVALLTIRRVRVHSTRLHAGLASD